MDSEANANKELQHNELIQFDSVDSSHQANGKIQEGDQVTSADFPKDAVDEWPAAKQIHTFYFVKYRTYEDPKLRAKIEQADKEIQKNNQARLQIFEALRAKRSERSNVISQLKSSNGEDKQYRMILDEKRREMEPLQSALGKLRSANNATREKGSVLCSSEEELDELIHSLHYRMQHESLTLNEEKKLIREIKQLEGTREKVIANAAMKSKIQDSLGHREDIQDQVKLIGGDMDGVRKKQQAVKTRIKHLEEELNSIDDEINSLQEELAAVNVKKEKAYQTLNELRKARDDVNTCYFQYRSILNNAKNLAAKKNISALQELAYTEVEKFMSQWSSDKSFRDDYEKRVLPSLDIRQLSRDGRMRNPHEKPVIFEAPASTEPEAAPSKVVVKRAKEDVIPPPLRHDIVSNKKVHDNELTRSTEVESREKSGDPVETETTNEVKRSQKESSKSDEVDAAKLKEMKRQEEIAKAKLASERKKKQAEKAAAKAASIAQKEAERKIKKKEKRARKKAGASVPAAEQAELDMQVSEPEEVNVNVDAPVPERSTEQNGNVRYRNRQKGQHQIPRISHKRKKSHSYWLWAVPVTVVVLVLVMLPYYSLGRN